MSRLVKSLCSLELGQRGRWEQQGCEARPHILLPPPCCLPDALGSSRPVSPSNLRCPMAASVWPLLELGAEMPAWGPVAGKRVVPGAQGGLGLGPSAPASCSRGSGQPAAPALGPGSGCYLSSPSSLSGKRLGVGGLPCLVASKLLSSSTSDNSRLHSGRGSCADRPQNQTDSHMSAGKRRGHNQGQFTRGSGGGRWPWD